MNVPLPDFTINTNLCGKKRGYPYQITHRLPFEAEGKTITNRIKIYAEIDFAVIHGEIDGQAVKETNNCSHKGWEKSIKLLED